MTRDIKIFPEGDGDGFPKIDFTGSGAGASAISLKVLSDSTLSFEGSEGQLFSITDNLSEGVIFSVADVGGLPLLEVDADGTVLLAREGDNVGIGVANPSEKLEVSGNALFSGNVSATNINNLQASATDHESRIDTLETDVSLAEADITTLEASATNHESRISTLESAPGGTSDHGALTGLGDDDHTQYVLATGARSMNSLSVTGNISVTGTVDGRDIAADGTKLDNHVASGSVHFTQASIHHGGIAGLSDDDHPQYVLATGSRSMNSLSVTGNISVTGTVDGRDIAADGTKLDNHVASGSVHFTEASIHHGSIAGLGDDDHTQYVLATGARSMNSLSVTGNIAVTGTVDGRDIAADGTKLDNHVASGSVHFTEASIHHGSIAGLGDDDHTQYVLATGARSMNSLSVTGNISVTGTVDGRDIAADGTKLDNHVASGSVHFTQASIHHGGIAGLSDDDHPQYVLATGSRSMNSLSVTGNIAVTGTVDGRDIAADGTKLDNHVASGSVHFTVASIDHGSIAGLGDDDHTQYLRADGTRALTGNISAGTNRITNLGDPVGTQDAVTAYWALTSFPLLAQNLLDLPNHATARDNLGLSGMATVADAPANGNTYGRKDNAWAQVDHGSIDGLDDDDHTQYVLATGARDITGDQRIDGALDVGNLSATWENMALDVVWDHLLPHDQNGNWTANVANGGATYQQNQGQTGGICEGVDIQGVMTASNNTGTASTAGASKYHVNLSTYLIAGTTHYFRCTANRATNIKVRFGVCNDALGATATPNNGAYFEFDPATDTDIQVVTAAGGTRTTTSTSLAGTTFAGTFRWYAIKVTDEGGGAIGIGFYDCTNGGTLLAKHTTNIPSSGANRAMRAFIQAIGAGQTYGAMWLDIYGVYIADWLPQNFVH